MTIVPKDAMSVVHRLLADLDTPRSLTVEILIRHGEWFQLVNLAVDPYHYCDDVIGQNAFARDFQATELLRKCSELPCSSPASRKLAARQGWSDSEHANAVTNARLTPWLYGYPAELDPAKAGRIWDVIQKARKEIRRVLGPVPETLHLERFGPGVYHGWEVEDRLPTSADKLATNITVSPAALAIFKHLFPETWERAFWENGSTFQLLDSEKFGTVPKNAVTDRTIGTQPLANLVMQLAVGQHIRQRLQLKAHIDLRNGSDLHARTAGSASRGSGDATVDLKNASNSLARGVIKLLFSEEWYELLCDLRVPTSLHQTKQATYRFRLEMFSAMGNGFTFELETLVFWALARAVEIDCPLVYGDDIIVPESQTKDLIAVLAYFGFMVNPRKTHVDGPFRESCGGNYFAGLKLTPARIETFPREPHEWISLHNALWRASPSLGEARTRRSRLAVLRHLPVSIRTLGGPTALGDLVLHGPSVFNRHEVRKEDCITYYRVWRPVQHNWPFERFGGSALQMSMALFGISPDGVGYRDNVTGHKLGWVPWS